MTAREMKFGAVVGQSACFGFETVFVAVRVVYASYVSIDQSQQSSP